MLKSAGSIGIAVIIAGFIAFLVTDAPQAKVPDGGPPQVEPLAKGDRLAAPAVSEACSLTGWPHYAQRCLYDNRSSVPAKSVRLIAMR
jgi:hypothetical protein